MTQGVATRMIAVDEAQALVAKERAACAKIARMAGEIQEELACRHDERAMFPELAAQCRKAKAVAELIARAIERGER